MENTNFYKFIRTWNRKHLALDEMSSDPVELIVKWAHANLSESQRRQLAAGVVKLPRPEDDHSEEGSPSSDLGQDRALRRGSASFDKMYPDAARIGQVSGVIGSRTSARSRGMAQDAGDSFDKMFPDAARIA